MKRVLSSTTIHRWILLDRVQERYKIQQLDLSTLGVPLYQLTAVLRNTTQIADVSLNIRQQRLALNKQSDHLSPVQGHRIHGPSVSAHVLLDSTYNYNPTTSIGEPMWLSLIRTHLIPTITNLTTSSTSDPIPLNQVAIICDSGTVQILVEAELTSMNIPHSDIRGQLTSTTPQVAVDDASYVDSMEWTFVAVVGSGYIGYDYSAPSRARSMLMHLDVVRPDSSKVTRYCEVYGDRCCFYKHLNGSLEKYNP